MHATLVRILVGACAIAGDHSGLDGAGAKRAVEGTVRRLQGTLAERSVPDPAPP